METVWRYLEIQDFLSLMETCKMLHRISLDATTWSFLLWRDYQLYDPVKDSRRQYIKSYQLSKIVKTKRLFMFSREAYTRFGKRKTKQPDTIIADNEQQVKNFIKEQIIYNQEEFKKRYPILKRIYYYLFDEDCLFDENMFVSVPDILGSQMSFDQAYTLTFRSANDYRLTISPVKDIL